MMFVSDVGFSAPRGKVRGTQGKAGIVWIIGCRGGSIPAAQRGQARSREVQPRIEQGKSPVVYWLVHFCWLAGRYGYVERVKKLDCVNLQLHVIDDFHGQARIKNVVMQAAILKVS